MSDEQIDEVVEQAENEDQPESKKAAAKRIANQLEEKDPKPRKQITMIVQRAGIEFADSILQETEEIESQGGMMIENGERRRTKGGVFFYLARKRLPDEIRDDIFTTWRAARKKRIAYESQFPSFEYDKRGEIFDALLEQERGELSDVRITLTGRPGEIDRREDLVITMMDFEANDKMTLPTGVPPFPLETVTYVVYISAKQWEKVDKAIQNPHDYLIIEGLCAFDEAVDKFAVYTTYLTTKKLQRKERKQAKQPTADTTKPKTQQQKKDAPKPEGKKKKKRDDKLPEPDVTPTIDLNLPDGVPADVAQKLAELHTAARVHRQKIEKMEENPDKNKFMLTTTRRLLKTTEKQISDLEKAHNIGG